MNVLTVPNRTAEANDGQRADNGPPIVAAIDGSAASRAAIAEAVRLGVELDAPIVFVYVRRGPPSFFGVPFYQRRLTKAMSRARRVLDRALAVAVSARRQRRRGDPRGLAASADSRVRPRPRRAPGRRRFEEAQAWAERLERRRPRGREAGGRRPGPSATGRHR